MMAESHGTREAAGHVGSTVSKPREKQIGAPLFLLVMQSRTQAQDNPVIPAW